MTTLNSGPTQPVEFRDLFPEPLHSSRSRAWTGVTLDLYRLGDLEFCGSHPEHLVSVQFTNCPRLYQRRNGRVAERPMLAGEIVVTPAGDPKSWRREGAGIVLLMGISPVFLDDLMEQATGQAGHVELLDNFGTRDTQIEALARALCGELRGERLGGRMFAQAACLQLGLHLLRHYASAPLRGESPLRMSAHKLRMARNYIEDELAQDLNVETIARAVGMSPFHFAHAFKAATGLPPHRFVMLRRFEAAKSLLRNSSLPLAEIAERAGYSSASHFSAGFHKIALMSPTEYRKNPAVAAKTAGMRTPLTGIRNPGRDSRG
jgi:AraC family transcriptional regulator